MDNKEDGCVKVFVKVDGRGAKNGH
jgi:hypothetical protein